MTWQDAAPCRGLTHLFFAPLAESAVTRRTRVAKAQAICRTCPYQRECAEASKDEVGGVWNGVDLDEPMLIRRRLSARERRGPKPKPINHGTNGGYVAHLRRGEQPCDECSAAHAKYAADSGTQVRWRASRWTRQFVAELRTAAVAESWALRNEMRTEVAA